MNRHLHIICARVPWPANNCESIDTFYAIEALHEQGIMIHLHYFCTDPNCHPTELNRYCESVHPYPATKTTGVVPAAGCAGSTMMTEAIGQDDHPVLFEGIHCTGTLQTIAASGRKIVVRMYNDECRYYDHLAQVSAGLFFKKIILRKRTREMKEYEDALPAGCIYAFSTKENVVSFLEDHPAGNAYYLPVFSPYQTVTGKTGLGNFCLYHGDLSDPCNEKAATWLLSKVFNDINTPLVIAGRSPGRVIKKLAEFYNHVCLVVDPSTGEMDDLVCKAHINVLPSFSNKKPELKLMHALSCGRHCVVNENAVNDTGFEMACHTGKNANAFKSIILQLYHRPFEEEEIRLRENIFRNISREKPAATLVNWLYS